RAAGAEIREQTVVRAVEPHGLGVRISARDEVIDARAAVIAAGARLKSLVPDLTAPLRATRQVMAWFEPHAPTLFARERFPVFLIEDPRGTYYGFPLQPGRGVKIAKHYHLDETVDPDDYDRSVSMRDENVIRPALAAYLPAANGKLAAAATCLYTMAPDGDFIIDTLPGLPQIVIASPCSGHGFKFAPLVGEILADLATKGATARDISLFRLSRFVKATEGWPSCPAGLSCMARPPQRRWQRRSKRCRRRPRPRSTPTIPGLGRCTATCAITWRQACSR